MPGLKRSDELEKELSELQKSYDQQCRSSESARNQAETASIAKS